MEQQPDINNNDQKQIDRWLLQKTFDNEDPFVVAAVVGHR